MPDGIDLIKQGIKSLRLELDKTLYPTAKEVKELQSVCSGDYSDTVLDQNGFGSDTAEIYFYLFAPVGFPRPSDKESELLLKDTERKTEYNQKCYSGWKEELQKVQGIVAKRGGTISVDDMPLQDYLNAVQESKEIPDHRVHVRISVPGQDELRLIKRVEEVIDVYEKATRVSAANKKD